IDSVLFADGAATPGAAAFVEGTPLPQTGDSADEHAWVRDLTTGKPKDSNDNASDFILVSTDAASIGGVQSRLGAPGPENVASPVNRSSQIKSVLFAPCLPSSVAPNRERDNLPYTDTLTPSSPTGVTAGVPNSAYASGTMRIRRRFVNNTGVALTRLRFRVVDVTAGTAAVGTADVRAVTSTDETVVLNPCLGSPTSTKGLTVEQPPAQPNGGGLNTSLAAGTISLSTPLAPSATIDLNFLLGVQTPGLFRFFVIVEALPGPASSLAPVPSGQPDAAMYLDNSKGAGPSQRGKGASADKLPPTSNKN
ncbi:MAG: hypothetical protein LC774_05525, partial [Acidobacteria bacterium]|nr:hypothetical protein [Acidobacteriota bacterium]